MHLNLNPGLGHGAVPLLHWGVKKVGQPEATRWATRTPTAPSFPGEAKADTCSPVPRGPHSVRSAELQDEAW